MIDRVNKLNSFFILPYLIGTCNLLYDQLNTLMTPPISPITSFSFNLKSYGRTESVSVN